MNHPLTIVEPKDYGPRIYRQELIDLSFLNQVCASIRRAVLASHYKPPTVTYVRAFAWSDGTTLYVRRD